MHSYDKLAFDEVSAALRRADFITLPGQPVQLTMAPDIRKDQIRGMGKGHEPVKSSVMILIYPGVEGSAKSVFIQRPKYDGVHSGQISFPGGRLDPDDEDMMQTALRETHEEIGISPDQVEVIGQLSELYIPPSNHLVSPFAGLLSKMPVFCPDPIEVACIIEVELGDFLSGNNKTESIIKLADGEIVNTPCYKTGEHIIWGATAMILAEFISLFNSAFRVVR